MASYPSACLPDDLQAAFPSSSGRACWPRRLSAWILKSHMRMMPEKGSKGNLDPSRASAPGDADTPVAGRDGPTVLPGFAGDGSWRSRSEEHTSELQSRFDL